MDSITIRRLRPGRVLDGHVHDVLGFPEPVWPYSTHPNAKGRLRDWLKSKPVKLWLAGEGHASDDCILEIAGNRRVSFEAVNENHALCLAVLLTDYQLKFGWKIPNVGFSGRLAD